MHVVHTYEHRYAHRVYLNINCTYQMHENSSVRIYAHSSKRGQPLLGMVIDMCRVFAAAYYAKSLHEDHVKSQLDSSISAPGIPGLGSPSRIHAIVPAICYMAKAQLQQPRYKRYTKKIAAQCYCTIRQNPSYNCY